ncbi:exonuclease domain-containing protein, partial [Streptomyces milbemycinicus]
MACQQRGPARTPRRSGPAARPRPCAAGARGGTTRRPVNPGRTRPDRPARRGCRRRPVCSRTMLEDPTAAAPHPAPPSSWPATYPQGYAVVDVETTGLARDDRIVSAAVYQLDARGAVQDHWYTLVNPQRDPGPVWIHGLTAEMLADAPRFPEIAEQLS